MTSNYIKPLSELVKDALVKLKRFQNGDEKLLRVGYDFLDDHMGGLLPGSIITIAGSSGTGKTYLAHKIIENIMSTSVNEDAKDFVSLEYSFEMLMLNKVMRTINQQTKLTRQQILTQQFDVDSAQKVKSYYENLKDDRRFVCQDPLTVDEWYKETRSFCQAHKDKKAIIVSIDHLILFKGSEKQKNIEKATDYQNELKLEFNNLYLFDLSQLNRESNFSGVKDRSNDVVPNSTWIYASSLIEMVSDYIIIIANPFKSGMTEFMSFNPSRYEYLSEFYAGEDAKGRQSFSTVGNLFYFVTKVRDSDIPYKNIFIEKMDITDETLEKMKQSVVVEKPPVLDIPVFGNTLNTIGWGDEESPF